MILILLVLVVAFASWLVGLDVSWHSIALGQLVPHLTMVWVLADLSMHWGTVAWHGFMYGCSVLGFILVLLDCIV